MRLKLQKPSDEKVVALELVQNTDGSMTVEDEHGWNLVTFNVDGTIISHESIGPESGFKLDKQGRICIEKD